MNAYTPQWYPSPIKLPAAKRGKAEIRHRIVKPGETLPIIGMRQALLRGLTPTRAKIEKALRVHELVEGGNLWMTDLPEELNQIAEMLHAARPAGRVLVGGLGLGIVASIVAGDRSVDEVVVVERSADVIALCRAPGYAVVHADIKEYLSTTTERFDYYLLDTWCGTNESTWWEEVMPLRRIIANRHRLSVVHCWAEDIMQGQVFRQLTTGRPHWHYSRLPVPMPARNARAFLDNVGLPAWERRYGVMLDKEVAHV